MMGLHKQACPESTILFVGDSNTEGMWWSYVCGNNPDGWAINGGIGGIRVAGYLNILPQVLAGTNPRFVTVALGTNDAYFGLVGTPEDKAWEENYTAVVDILMKNGKYVALFTIPPVEKGKQLGEGYFLTTRIQRFNAHIRSLAKQRNLPLQDVYAMWANAQGFAPSGTTTDGVHFTHDRQAAYYEQLEDAVRAMRKPLGMTCP